MSIKINIERKLNDYPLKINFEIGREKLALLGNSGSGKSMTLKSIAGIEKPDRGIISINDREVFNSEKNLNIPSRDRNVGYLFQNYALFPHMKVLENLTICMNTKNRESEAKKILEYFKVENQYNRYPYELSGGQQQRVAMARMIATNPKVILLDEPFSALDTNLRWEMENDFSQFLNTSSYTSILVTHNKDEAYRMCDKIAILSEGKVVDFGEKDRVYRSPATVEAALIVGFRNIFKIKECKNGIYLKELNYYVENITLGNGFNNAAIKAEDFYLSKIENSEELKFKLKFYSEDTKNIIALFELTSEKVLTVEINKSNDDEDKKTLKYLRENIDRYIPVYFSKTKLKFLK